MRLSLQIISLCFASIALADQAASHRFDSNGAREMEGFPEHSSPKIYVIAEKSQSLHFSGLPADRELVFQIHRVTAASSLKLDSVKAQFVDGGWHLTWTPPKTRGPAQYIILLQGETKPAVRIESRDPEWLNTARETLSSADWEAHGLSTEERSALSGLGIQTGRATSRAIQADTSLEMRPRQGAASRRRVVWDAENHHLVVWQPGPVVGDLEVLAPRWWISPEALATDHGLIRFLDLLTEPPLRP